MNRDIFRNMSFSGFTSDPAGYPLDPVRVRICLILFRHLPSGSYSFHLKGPCFPTVAEEEESALEEEKG